LNILFIASEVTPLAKTGGLADVVGSLPKELKRLGHDVRIVIPFYREVAQAGHAIAPTGLTARVMLGQESREASLATTAIGDIPVYLVGNEGYFFRDHLYGTPAGDYPDNHLRFAFFCRAALALTELAGFRPDVIHCHDWQAALVPIILHHERADHPFFARAATVFTIHNLAYQGLFPPESLADMGLDPALFTMEQLEFYGRVNLLKGGILFADSITTVSPTYCREILTTEHGCGLEGVLRVRRKALHGILNGLDYEIWDPATDRGLVANYSTADRTAKAANKRALQEALGLEPAPHVPLLGMVSRLAEQKGFDLMARLLPRFACAPLQLVIVGAGDAKYVRLLERVRRRHPANISITIGFAPWAARVYGGSDLFVMPSRYEPCGLGQLIALRYGSVPLVRRTGGLADTVVDPRDAPEAATGFTFDAYDREALWEAVGRALKAYGEPGLWGEMVRHGMSQDFSWTESARQYEALYGATLTAKRKD
jgi:starch synthase